MTRKFIIFMQLFGILLLPFIHARSSAQADVTSENDVKSAYLFNFAKFVEWPERAFASKTSPIILCVVGEDSLGAALDNLESKKIKGRPLVVVRSRNKEQIKPCHILYVSDSEKKDLPDILSRFGGRSCLTVSSVSDFANQGGMIGFVRKGNNIRFEVNLEAIKRGELSVSSRLLNLALIVKGQS